MHRSWINTNTYRWNCHATIHLCTYAFTETVEGVWHIEQWRFLYISKWCCSFVWLMEELDSKGQPEKTPEYMVSLYKAFNFRKTQRTFFFFLVVVGKWEGRSSTPNNPYLKIRWYERNKKRKNPYLSSKLTWKILDLT